MTDPDSTRPTPTTTPTAETTTPTAETGPAGVPGPAGSAGPPVAGVVLPGPWLPGPWLPGPWLPGGVAEAPRAVDAAAAGAVAGEVLGRAASRRGRAGGRWWSAGQSGRLVVLARAEGDPGRLRVVVLRAGRGVLRAVWRLGRGNLVLARRLLDAATHGVIREQIRAARASGDAVALAAWVDRLRDARTARHERVKGLPVLLGSVVVTATAALGVAGALVGAGGVAVALTHAGWSWQGYWGFWGGLFHTATTVAVWGLRLAPWAALAGWAAVAWRSGAPDGTGPRWLATSTDGEVDLAIDESTITQALKALRIAQITDYLKTGAPMQYLTPARADGRGTHAVVRLPGGVPAGRIIARRADLASGLHRLAKEVWPAVGPEEGILDLWIANKGALAEGAGAYPLLDGGLTDVFRGVPFGRTLRGDAMVAPLMGRNTIVGGMPGQGKSSGARVIMAGAALDPTAELRIWIPDHNYDFDGFRPRASRFVMGTDPADFAAIAADLRELHAEVQQRGKLLGQYEEPEVTRPLASKGVGLHPLVCLLEEAHVAFNHEVHGKEIAHLAVEIVRLGRKRGIHLIVSTQAPTKDSIPRDVTRNCSNGIAYAVGDHVANDALLGQGAYRAGHRATDLIPGTDIGTAVVKGFTGERSATAQSYFLSVSRGNDQIGPLVRRSLDAIARTGRAVPGTDRPRADTPPPEARDLLDDLDAVLGTDIIRVADVPALLRDHAPHWAPYHGLTGADLRAQLAGLGVKVPSTGNRYPLDPLTVREAIARRSTADLDE